MLELGALLAGLVEVAAIVGVHEAVRARLQLVPQPGLGLEAEAAGARTPDGPAIQAGRAELLGGDLHRLRGVADGGAALAETADVLRRAVIGIGRAPV